MAVFMKETAKFWSRKSIFDVRNSPFLLLSFTELSDIPDADRNILRIEIF